MTTKMRIRHQFGRYNVEALDNNEVWVPPSCSEPHDFATREEAKEYIEGWVYLDSATHDPADDIDPDAD